MITLCFAANYLNYLIQTFLNCVIFFLEKYKRHFFIKLKCCLETRYNNNNLVISYEVMEYFCNILFQSI